MDDDDDKTLEGTTDPAAAAAATAAATEAAAKIARLESENQQLQTNKEAVDLMRQRMAVAKDLYPEHHAITESVLRGVEYVAPTTTPSTLESGLPDDLDDHDKALLKMGAQISAEAVEKLLKERMAPLERELRMSRLEKQTHSLMDTYKDRVEANPDLVKGLLEDPAAQREGIDRAFHAADYPALHAENAKLRAEIAERAQADEKEVAREAGIMKLAGPGGRAPVGAPPSDDPKVKYKDSKSKMRDILMHNLGLE